MVNIDFPSATSELRYFTTSDPEVKFVNFKA